MSASGGWYVYMLRCSDNSLYTGVTTDLDKRLDQHNGLTKNGARYTRARQPVRLVYQESLDSRSQACQREAQIKRLSKPEKEMLVAQWPGRQTEKSTKKALS